MATQTSDAKFKFQEKLQLCVSMGLEVILRWRLCSRIVSHIPDVMPADILIATRINILVLKLGRASRKIYSFLTPMQPTVRSFELGQLLSVMFGRESLTAYWLRMADASIIESIYHRTLQYHIRGVGRKKSPKTIWFLFTGDQND